MTDPTHTEPPFVTIKVTPATRSDARTESRRASADLDDTVTMSHAIRAAFRVARMHPDEYRKALEALAEATA